MGLKYKDTEGNVHYKETEIHLIEHTIGILIGLDTMDEWGSDVKISKSGISLPGPNNKEFIVTGKREGGHIAIQTIPASESDKFYPKQPKPFVPGKNNRNNTRFVKQEYDQIEIEDNMEVTVQEKSKDDTNIARYGYVGGTIANVSNCVNSAFNWFYDKSIDEEKEDSLK